MSRLRAALRRRVLPGRDAGMSIAELAVTMMVTGILLAAVATVTIGMLKAVRVVNVKAATAADARIGMEAMSRTLRAASIPTGATSSVTVATSNQVTFYSMINRTTALTVSGTVIPTLIEYYYSGNCLMEAQTPARVSGASYAWDTGRVAKCLLRTTAAPTFSYYTSGSATTPLTVPTGGLTASDRQSVQSVEVALTATDANNSTVAGLPVDVRITLDNVVLSAGGTA